MRIAYGAKNSTKAPLEPSITESKFSGVKSTTAPKAAVKNKAIAIRVKDLMSSKV